MLRRRNEYDLILKSSSYCQAVPRLHDVPEKAVSGGAGPGAGAMVALVWQENVELICMQLTFV